MSFGVWGNQAEIWVCRPKQTSFLGTGNMVYGVSNAFNSITYCDRLSTNLAQHVRFAD